MAFEVIPCGVCSDEAALMEEVADYQYGRDLSKAASKQILERTDNLIEKYEGAKELATSLPEAGVAVKKLIDQTVQTVARSWSIEERVDNTLKQVCEIQCFEVGDTPTGCPRLLALIAARAKAKARSK